MITTLVAIISVLMKRSLYIPAGTPLKFSDKIMTLKSFSAVNITMLPDGIYVVLADKNVLPRLSYYFVVKSTYDKFKDTVMTSQPLFNICVKNGRLVGQEYIAEFTYLGD